MRTITLIIIHCSATREGKRYTAEDCKLDHIGHKHCTDIGYHFYIEKDGKKVGAPHRAGGRPLPAPQQPQHRHLLRGWL